MRTIHSSKVKPRRQVRGKQTSQKAVQIAALEARIDALNKTIMDQDGLIKRLVSDTQRDADLIDVLARQASENRTQVNRPDLPVEVEFEWLDDSYADKAAANKEWERLHKLGWRVYELRLKRGSRQIILWRPKGVAIMPVRPTAAISIPVNRTDPDAHEFNRDTVTTVASNLVVAHGVPVR